MLTTPRQTALFVSGCKSNQAQFYNRFDCIVLLSVPAELMFERIARRTDNPYGKTEAEKSMILRHLHFVEPLLRAGADIELNTAALSIDEVVNRLGALVK